MNDDSDPNFSLEIRNVVLVIVVFSGIVSKEKEAVDRCASVASVLGY
jgi:hypothetical protein